jgi:hypothetical protein
MGYGGFIKTVIRIAVPAVVGVLTFGNPLAIAISSAAVTGATGGSFKEALISGATSYIGASITQSLNAGTLGAVGGPPAPSYSDFIGGGNIPVDVGARQIFDPGAVFPGINVTDAALGIPEGGFTSLAAAAAPVAASGIGLFPEAFGDVRSAFDAGGSLLDKSLASLGVPELGAKVGQQFGTDTLFTIGGQQFSGANLANLGIGGFTGLTLEQALLANDPLVDAQLEQAGLSPAGIQSLRQEARNRLAQQKFEELTGEGSALANPFLRGGQDEAAAQAAQDEFLKVIAAGIERENVALGPTVTQQQFDARFTDPSFGQNVLQSEEDLRKQAFNQAIGGTFPGGAFDPIDDDIINAILDERIEPVQRQVATAGARGNLNLYGGRTANEELSRQRDVGFENVSQIGEGLQQGSQSEVDFIRDRASADVRGYQLGDELFDVAPFSQERSDLIGAREGSLGADLSSAVGNQPIFDVQKALNIGGRAQGPVSGPVNQSFLDAIARGGGGPAAAKTRRGLGQSGRGVF